MEKSPTHVLPTTPVSRTMLFASLGTFAGSCFLADACGRIWQTHLASTHADLQTPFSGANPAATLVVPRHPLSFLAFELVTCLDFHPTHKKLEINV